MWMKTIANDFMIELTYGSKKPYIDIRGKYEGFDIFYAMRNPSWLEFFQTRYDQYDDAKARLAHAIKLPEDVEAPFMYTMPYSGWFVACGKRHTGYWLCYEEKYAENFEIYTDFWSMLMITETVDMDMDE